METPGVGFGIRLIDMMIERIWNRPARKDTFEAGYTSTGSHRMI